MIEISQREFQIRFYELVKGKEEIRVYKKGGEVVGVWTPTDVENAVHEEMAKGKREVVNAVQENEDAVHELERSKNNMDKFLKEQEVEIEEEGCGKCGREQVVGYWSGWDEVNGEEVRDMAVCKVCGLMCGKVGIRFKE